MDKAKAAIGSFLAKDGKHDTTVHETVNPAITNEQVTRTHQENVTQAVDREVHQDHHHTSVQPIQHREVIPEQHSHNVVGVEHRNVKHGNDDHVKEKLAAEQARFKSTRTVGDVEHTTSANPTLTGEHVHHHVHENIQPVVQKETIQPSVVHTTIPVHEIHQNEAKHHTATQLPPVTMDEFQRQGGHLSGREERRDAFNGEPKAVGGTLGGAGARGTTSLTDADDTAHNSRQGHHLGTNGGTGVTGTSTAGGKHHLGQNDGTGFTGTSTTGREYNSGTSTGTSATGSHGVNRVDSMGKKPTLMDKLNPKVDSNGDGRAGFMK